MGFAGPGVAEMPLDLNLFKDGRGHVQASLIDRIDATTVAGVELGIVHDENQLGRAFLKRFLKYIFTLYLSSNSGTG